MLLSAVDGFKLASSGSPAQPVQWRMRRKPAKSDTTTFKGASVTFPTCLPIVPTGR
ncbi:unnamed protein product [Plutella xylostella]|uniref:(diamondback moth) hypothetical protein n=1 Tax=Plutella xylostella TaxID=51655 RepID=A0A8S4E778_PLUXY|nr:unnamed protein product [Plutella xylostella]